MQDSVSLPKLLTLDVLGDLTITVDVPYIANWIYEHPAGLDLSLKGISIADPSLSYNLVQQEIPALRFAQANFYFLPSSHLF